MPTRDTPERATPAKGKESRPKGWIQQFLGLVREFELRRKRVPPRGPGLNAHQVATVALRNLSSYKLVGKVRRWQAVARHMGLEAGPAVDLCKEYGLDPWEIV